MHAIPRANPGHRAAPAVRALHAAPALLASLFMAACQSAGNGGPDTAPTPAAEAARVPACRADATVMQGWDERAPPRRIHGNTWYVGTCGLSSLLVTSQQGHVLIDGASTAAGPHIEANIRALGFDPADVKYLLNSHEHYDHAGGLAHLQAVSGAPLLVRGPAAAALGRGKGDRSDPQQLVAEAFAGVPRVQVIADGHVVRVGPLALTAHATPGHTPGSTSWTWRSCEGGHCLDIAYTDSVSALSDGEYRYLDRPGVVEAFRRSLDTVAGLPCDIQVAPHPGVGDLFARLDGEAGKPLVDPAACRRYAEGARTRLDRRLEEEAQGLKP